MEENGVQDLEALADVLLLWDLRNKASAEESARERRANPLTGHSTRWHHSIRNAARDGVLDSVLGDVRR